MEPVVVSVRGRSRGPVAGSGRAERRGHRVHARRRCAAPSPCAPAAALWSRYLEGFPEIGVRFLGAAQGQITSARLTSPAAPRGFTWMAEDNCLMALSAEQWSVVGVSALRGSLMSMRTSVRPCRDPVGAAEAVEHVLGHEVPRHRDVRAGVDDLTAPVVVDNDGGCAREQRIECVDDGGRVATAPRRVAPRARPRCPASAAGLGDLGQPFQPLCLTGPR